MKVIIVLAILIGIALPILFYKRDKDLKNLFISLLLLSGIVSLLIIGNIMRSLAPLFIAHFIALIISYGSYIVYLIRDKFYWHIYILPFATLALYVILAFVGNRHISGF
ncbi:MAG TPA: hypothetical protein ENK99_02875 [Campylobacterales bacterium]|jgi:hypothetical protein|nr:hypothetical protein [Campylobacterales bacterium]